ncbi:MAG TPA: nitrilase-related carbon-nitrogen hydrolase [Nitrospirota bacterium]|nr:nitrilase-related carbon-nitrogen hydrolase [Nitrospirota bacterium]
MRIAGVQISTGLDVERNIQRAIDMAMMAAEKDATIICYPELFYTPWFPLKEEESFLSWAQSAASEKLMRFKELSENKKLVLIIPFFESSNGKYYNSAAVFDSGKSLGIYRKIHIPDLPLYREQFYFSPGDTGFPVFDTSQGKIGIQICWDNLFPEGARILALKGAEIIFAPTAASLSSHTLWERAICANAFANNIFIFRVNRVGKDDSISFYGRSFCVDPWGEMASELAGGKDAIVIADVDRNEREAASKVWGFLNRRRPGEYGELLKI